MLVLVVVLSQVTTPITATARYMRKESTFDVAMEGYSYSDRETMMRGYYDNEMNRGMVFSYEWLIEDGRHFYHVVHQYDGKIYEPHDRIDENLTITYTVPSGITPGSTVDIPYNIHWEAVNKAPTGSLAMLQIIVVAGSDPNSLSQIGGEMIYLSDTDDLEGTYSLKLQSEYQYLNIYVMTSNFMAGGLGKGYAYQLFSDSTVADSVVAKPTAAKVYVDGNQISFDAYNINGSNYFKLRDLAKAVNGSSKNFEVSWDSQKNSIMLYSDHAYTSVGGELAVNSVRNNQTAGYNNSRIFMDGSEIILTAYRINGSNYFKLRDLGKVMNFGVNWNSTTQSIDIQTNLNYTE